MNDVSIDYTLLTAYLYVTTSTTYEQYQVRGITYLPGTFTGSSITTTLDSSHSAVVVPTGTVQYNTIQGAVQVVQ